MYDLNLGERMFVWDDEMNFAHKSFPFDLVVLATVTDVVAVVAVVNVTFVFCSL